MRYCRQPLLPLSAFISLFLLSIIFGLFASADALLQDDVYPREKKPSPTEIVPDIWILGGPVVIEQWPQTLDLVNAPSNLQQAEPGQCVRVGVIAIGDNRDQRLKSAKYEVEVDYGGHVRRFPPEPPETIKQIKPEGGDFVTQVLGAAGIKNPLTSMASMAASRAEWCVPADAKDGLARIYGSAVTADGTRVPFNTHTIEIRTFQSARSTAPFADMREVGVWLMSYYAAPDPAQLLPALRVVSADKEARTALNMMQFFVIALKRSPLAAQELMNRLAAEQPEVRIYSLPLLAQAGYSTETLLKSLGELEEKDKPVLASVPLPDPFDFTPERLLFQKMDMLWSIFFASGDIKPVEAIASMLAWKKDYEDFEKIREAHQKDPQQRAELSDSIIRGVVYQAAGWSLNSISRQSGLVLDYIDVFKTSASLPATEKRELDELYTDLAFRRK